MLTARRLLHAKLHDVEMSVRGVLRGFGLKVGATRPKAVTEEPPRVRWNQLTRTSKRSIFTSLEHAGRRNRDPLSPDVL